jgi:hypothetical protein
MEGQKIDLLAKFIQTAAENSETIDIFQSRKYLHPHEKLLKTHLDEGWFGEKKSHINQTNFLHMIK